MHDEMKFLIPFYALIAAVISAFLLFTLFDTQLVSLVLVVLAFFAAGVVLALDLARSGRSD